MPLSSSTYLHDQLLRRNGSLLSKTVLIGDLRQQTLLLQLYQIRSLEVSRDNQWQVAPTSDRRMRIRRLFLQPFAFEFPAFDTISPAKGMQVNQSACLIGAGAPQQIVASRQLDLERSALID